MYSRQPQLKLLRLLQQFPAVGLLGPRQAGKTTLAFAQKEFYPNALYLDLELPSAQRQLDDPEAFLMAHAQQLVILDEVQRMPDLFSILRRSYRLCRVARAAGLRNFWRPGQRGRLEHFVGAWRLSLVVAGGV
jgi:predicted AAA+ superfamily ATPase